MPKKKNLNILTATSKRNATTVCSRHRADRRTYAPGPNDSVRLFDEFIDNMRNAKQ